MGELLRGASTRRAPQAEEAEWWTAEEVDALVRTAEEHEPRFAPLLRLAFGTGMRLGELVGLHWEDVNFERSELRVRRSVSKGRLGPPKNGEPRTVQLAAGLAEMLFDLLAERRIKALGRGWPEVPAAVFCTASGAYDLNLGGRTWNRVRRRAQKAGVRPFKFHCTRHTWATHARPGPKPCGF